MEDTLRATSILTCEQDCFGLNPCFNGRYSQSYKSFSTRCYEVLILVLMEDTLRDNNE